MSMPNTIIIHNRIRCKRCGDVIESKSRHDFVTCRCGACSVDGGHDYLRRCFAEHGCYDDLSVTEPRNDTNEIQLSLEEANKLIDDVAKRILDEYHDAFTELAKGPDT